MSDEGMYACLESKNRQEEQLYVFRLYEVIYLKSKDNIKFDTNFSHR